MGVDRPNLPLFRPFLTPQQNQQIRDLADLVIKSQPLPTVPETAATGLPAANAVFQAFEEYPGDFRRNLPGHWSLTVNIIGGRRGQIMDIRFTGPNGTVDTVVTNPLTSSASRYTARIEEMREDRGRWFKVHFNQGDMRFEGQTDQRILRGSVYNAAGQHLGDWNALKRRDLDYLDLAEQAKRAKNTEAALHYYNAAIRVNGSADNYVSRANLHYAARDYPTAIADYNAALERNSYHLNARFNRMASHYYARQHTEALADADAFIAQRTGAPTKTQLAQVHHFRGDILWWLERSEDAEKAYTTAIALDPKLAERNRAANTREWAAAQFLKSQIAVNRVMSEAAAKMSESTEALKKANAIATRETPRPAAPAPSAGDAAELEATLAGLVAATVRAVDAKDWAKALDNSATALNLAQKLGSTRQIDLITGLRTALGQELYNEGVINYKSGESDRMIARFEQAASLAHPDAHYMLGLAYTEGEGVAPDLVTARKWLGQAADLGHEQAKTALADPRYAIEPGAAEFAQGDALRQAGDHAAALPFLKQAATLGHTQAAYAVGAAYLDGKGVARDLAEASDWIELCQENFRKAPNSRNQIMAENARTALIGAKLQRTMTGAGNAEAAQGVAHHEAEEYAQALTAFRAAAALGNADGMRGLGHHYLNGQGVKLDLDESRKWLRRALAFDHPQAAADLRALENKARSHNFNR